METEKKSMSPEESFALIQQMISTAKNEVKGDSFIFLLWGWLVFICSTFQFIFIKVYPLEHGDRVWILMYLGAVIHIGYFIKKRKKERTNTYPAQFMGSIWLAFAVSIIILMVFNHMDWGQILPTIIILYGIGLYLSGVVLKFKPLMIGGLFCWACSIAGFLIQNEYILLVVAVAVLGGYIIPGYLLNFKNIESV